MHIKEGHRALNMSWVVFDSNVLHCEFNPLKWFHANALLKFLLYRISMHNVYSLKMDKTTFGDCWSCFLCFFKISKK